MEWSHLPLVCPTALATDVFLPVLVEPPLSTPTAHPTSIGGGAAKPFRTSFKADPFPLNEPPPSTNATNPTSKTQTTPRKTGAPGTQVPTQQSTPSRTNQNTPIRPNQNAHTVATTPTTAKNTANNQLTPGSSSNAGKSANSSEFYCNLCRKKFSNEATYRGHESSSKHQKEAKAHAAQLAAAAKQSQSRTATPQKASTPLKAGPRDTTYIYNEADEALAEALLHKQQAQQAEGSDLLMAIQLYWRAGTVFAQKSHNRDTVECLDRLLRLADVEGPNTKIPSHVLHEARLLLARSLYHFDPPMAAEYFCAALARYFPMTRLAELEDVWDDMPTLLAQCRTQYESLVARIPQKATPQEPKEHPRLVLHCAVQDLLLETYGCLARAGPTPALVLLAALHCAAESAHFDWTTSRDFANATGHTSANVVSSHHRLGRVYRMMECEWWCVDCAVSAFEASKNGTPSIKGYNGVDVDDVIGALADASCLALAAADEVRCRRLERLVSENRPIVRGPRANECILLAELSGAFFRGDWQWMECNAQKVNACGTAGVRDVYELCAKRAVCW